MTKTTFFSFLLIFAIAFGVTSCTTEAIEGEFVVGTDPDGGGGDGDGNAACEQAAVDTATTLAAFNAVDQSDTQAYTDACNAYKVALVQQISSCGDETGAIQAVVDSLGDCTPDSSTGSITVTVGTLPMEFTVIDVVVEGTLLKVTASEADGDDKIYFEIEQGVTGTDMIQNFVITLLNRDYTPFSFNMNVFTSEITVNENNMLEGTFSGPVQAANNASLSLTSGVIDISY